MKHNALRGHGCRQGFSLYEVLIVVAILGIVAVLAIPQVQKAQVRAKATSESENLRIIESAKSQFSRANPGKKIGSVQDLAPFLPAGQLPISPWAPNEDPESYYTNWNVIHSTVTSPVNGDKAKEPPVEPLASNGYNDIVLADRVYYKRPGVDGWEEPNTSGRPRTGDPGVTGTGSGTGTGTGTGTGCATWTDTDWNNSPIIDIGKDDPPVPGSCPRTERGEAHCQCVQYAETTLIRNDRDCVREREWKWRDECECNDPWLKTVEVELNTKEEGCPLAEVQKKDGCDCIREKVGEVQRSNPPDNHPEGSVASDCWVEMQYRFRDKCCDPPVDGFWRTTFLRDEVRDSGCWKVFQNEEVPPQCGGLSVAELGLDPPPTEVFISGPVNGEWWWVVRYLDGTGNSTNEAAACFKQYVREHQDPECYLNLANATYVYNTARNVGGSPADPKDNVLLVGAPWVHDMVSDQEQANAPQQGQWWWEKVFYNETGQVVPSADNACSFNWKRDHEDPTCTPELSDQVWDYTPARNEPNGDTGPPDPKDNIQLVSGPWNYELTAPVPAIATNNVIPGEWWWVKVYYDKDGNQLQDATGACAYNWRRDHDGPFCYENEADYRWNYTASRNTDGDPGDSTLNVDLIGGPWVHDRVAPEPPIEMGVTPGKWWWVKVCYDTDGNEMDCASVTPKVCSFNWKREHDPASCYESVSDEVFEYDAAENQGGSGPSDTSNNVTLTGGGDPWPHELTTPDPAERETPAPGKWWWVRTMYDDNDVVTTSESDMCSYEWTRHFSAPECYESTSDEVWDYDSSQNEGGTGPSDTSNNVQLVGGPDTNHALTTPDPREQVAPTPGTWSWERIMYDADDNETTDESQMCSIAFKRVSLPPKCYPSEYDEEWTYTSSSNSNGSPSDTSNDVDVTGGPWSNHELTSDKEQQNSPSPGKWWWIRKYLDKDGDEVQSASDACTIEYTPDSSPGNCYASASDEEFDYDSTSNVGGAPSGNWGQQVGSLPDPIEAPGTSTDCHECVMCVGGSPFPSGGKIPDGHCASCDSSASDPDGLSWDGSGNGGNTHNQYIQHSGDLDSWSMWCCVSEQPCDPSTYPDPNDPEKDARGTDRRSFDNDNRCQVFDCTQTLGPSSDDYTPCPISCTGRSQYSSPLLIDLFKLGYPDLLSGSKDWKNNRAGDVVKSSAFRRFDLGLNSKPSLPSYYEWVGTRSGILVHWPDAAPKDEAYPIQLDGSYLFGNHTFGRKDNDAWKHGYEPLATLDANKDGSLKASELSAVWVWLDANSDARVDKGEMRPATDYVKSLTVKATVDSAGNAEAPVGAELLDGSKVPTWDWWAKAWTYDFATDFFTTGNGISREPHLTSANSGAQFDSHLYYWTISGEHSQGGVLRFVWVGADLYVVGSSDKMVPSSRGYLKSVYTLPISKVTRNSDGSLSWAFHDGRFGRVDTATVSVAANSGLLVGKNTMLYNDGSKASYDWVAEPVPKDFVPTPVTAPLVYAMTAFGSNELQWVKENTPDFKQLIFSPVDPTRAAAARNNKGRRYLGSVDFSKVPGG